MSNEDIKKPKHPNIPLFNAVVNNYKINILWVYMYGKVSRAYFNKGQLHSLNQF